MRRLNSHSLRNEIILVLIIKLTLIYLLWIAFFSQPVTDKLTEDEVAQFILSPPQRSQQFHGQEMKEIKEMINGR